MKIFLLLVTGIVFSGHHIAAQNIGINATGALPDSSAMLDISSTSKGILIPRLSTAQRTAIASPAQALMVFDKGSNSFWYYNGVAWVQVTTGSDGWNLTGNTGTNPAIQFIGTTDNRPLRFRINNRSAGLIDSVSSNTGMGFRALDSVSLGFANTATGYKSLLNNTTGSTNTAAGYNTLRANSTGSGNTALGAYALFGNTTASVNTAVGFAALSSNTTGSGNTASGFNALSNNTTGNYNNATGQEALLSNITGSNNTANGAKSLASNTSGDFNTAAGANALASNTTGSNNTASGETALYSNSAGNYNAAMGVQSLYFNSTGSNNTASGAKSLFASTTGSFNTAQGANALGANTTGGNNTASGESALYSNNTGNTNTASGYQALYANTAGASNTALGAYALNANTVGNNNIAIGAFSGTGGPNAASLSNTIGIGNTGGFLNGASNQVIIGNENMLFIGGKVNWGVVSDARIKQSITEDVKGLTFIMKLRPVTYFISNKAISSFTGMRETAFFAGKNDVEKIRYSGFLAQEVEQAAKAVNYEFSGYDAPKTASQLYTIKYAEFVVPLVKAVQEQQKMIADLTQQLAAVSKHANVSGQELMMATQQKQIAVLEKRLAALEKKQ